MSDTAQMVQVEHNTEKQDKQPKLPLFSRMWIFLLAPFFARIKFFKKNIALIRKTLKKGAVIHVFQYPSKLEYLILNYFLIKNDLPVVRLKRVGFWASFYSIIRPSYKDKLENQPLEKGDQSILFLQKPGSFLSVKSQSRIGEIQQLIELQKKQETPIQLMPHITIWSKRPVSMTQSYFDVFFGNSLNPGFWRKVVIFLRHFRTAFVRSGQPVSVDDWTSEEFKKHGKDPVKELRWRIYKFFSEERMAVTGPMTKPRTWILESVLNSDAVQKVIHEISEEQDRSVDNVTMEAAKELDFMAADYKYSVLVMAAVTVHQAIKRLYKQYIDKEGFERIREHLKKESVIFVPSHKSYMDFLVWSYNMHYEGMFPPHIIAGENMAFWPMGYLFRRMGAIFIRRSFKGNRLYAILLRQYLTRMLQEGYTVEFFIEGTRSRTGKMLPPKFGILSIYVDAFLKNSSRKFTFIPISIVYSKLVEGQSHTSELEGGKKVQETTSGLFKIFNVFKQRFGSLHIRVGDAISLGEYFKEHDFDINSYKEKDRQKVISELGHTIIHKINKATTVTPSSVVALAVLASGKKGITQKALMENIEVVLAHLKHANASFAKTVDDSLWGITETIEKMKNDGIIQSHTIGNEVIFTMNENKRHMLDYNKNYILHHFATSSFIALSFLSQKKNKVDQKQLLKNVTLLTEMFKFELSSSPDETIEDQFEKNLSRLISLGIFVTDDMGNVSATEKAEKELGFYAQLFTNFLESYWLVATVLPSLLDTRMNSKKFMKLLLEEGRKKSLIGELERNEAFSKLNFQNAIDYFVSRGIVIKLDQFEDTTITILPQETLDDRKKMKKIAKKRQVYYELAEDYSNEVVLNDLLDQFRFFLKK